MLNELHLHIKHLNTLDWSLHSYDIDWYFSHWNKHNCHRVSFKYPNLHLSISRLWHLTRFFPFWKVFQLIVWFQGNDVVCRWNSLLVTLKILLISNEKKLGYSYRTNLWIMIRLCLHVKWLVSLVIESPEEILKKRCSIVDSLKNECFFFNWFCDCLCVSFIRRKLLASISRDRKLCNFTYLYFIIIR